MADIDKGLPGNTRTEIKMPSEEEMAEVSVQEEVTEQGPVEVTPEEDGGATINFEPGAINIPLNNLASRMTDLRNDAETIYIICRRGIASVTATKLLLKAGFNNVRNINGGLDKWSQDVDPSLPMY